MNQTPKVEKKVWTVKCLRETFVPQGALLLGPDIKSDDRVVNSEYVEALEQDKQDLIDALRSAGFVLDNLGNKRSQCNSYECCGNCGEIYQAEEAFDKLREVLTKMGVSL